MIYQHFNFQGAFWGMVLGQTCGLVRLVLDFVYPAPRCDETDTRPSVVSAVNFTYFSAILLVLSAFLAVLISLCTAKPTSEMVSESDSSTINFLFSFTSFCNYG